MPTKKNKKIIIGNWKENPNTHDAAKAIVKDIKKVASKLTKTEVVLCPPYVFLGHCTSKKGSMPFFAGAQNVSVFESGSHTGEVSAQMLKDSGVSYVIVGHSERRKMGETDSDVSKKVQALHNVDIRAVVCIGEEKRDHTGAFLDTIKHQIKDSLIGVEKKNLENLVIAYEPVWAIGANAAMSTDEIHETSIFIKKTLADIFGHEYVSKIPVLYGGSVNFRNASQIVHDGHVDGLLVGRESVNPLGFNEILKSIDSL